MGCPVVAATGHAVEEVVGDYAGLIPNPTVAAMVAATKRALAVDRTDLLRRGQAVAERYTWRRYAGAMAAVYAELGVPMEIRWINHMTTSVPFVSSRGRNSNSAGGQA